MSIQKTYTHILFDLDGCIADSLPFWLDSYQKTFQSFGLQVNDTEIIDIAFYYFERLNELGISDVYSFADKVVATMMTQSRHVKLHAHALECIKALHQKGKQLFVVSSSRRIFIEAVLKNEGILDCFSDLITGDDVKNRKPHADPIHKALNDNPQLKENSLMVGDSDVDVAAANNAGIDSVWFYPKENYKYYRKQDFLSVKTPCCQAPQSE